MPYKQQMYIDWKETCKQQLLPELKDQQKLHLCSVLNILPIFLDPVCTKSSYIKYQL